MLIFSAQLTDSIALFVLLGQYNEKIDYCGQRIHADSDDVWVMISGVFYFPCHFPWIQMLALQPHLYKPYQHTKAFNEVVEGTNCAGRDVCLFDELFPNFDVLLWNEYRTHQFVLAWSYRYLVA
jgi:hypothetical protein